MAVKRASSRKSAARTRGIVAGTSGNGMKTFAIHSADAAAAPLMAKMHDERGHMPSFAAATASLPNVDPETAATRYLHQALGSKALPAFVAPLASGNVSEFKSLGTVTVPLTGTKVVKYRQTYAGIPVYGSLVSVELDDANQLVSMNSSLGEPEQVDAVAKISPKDALKAISAAPGCTKDLGGIVPKLSFYFDKPKAKWRLVFIAEDVPVTRKAGKAKKSSGEARLAPFRMDYVVDAHTGALVAQLPRTPTFAELNQSAKDGKGVDRTFTVEASGSQKVLQDKKANIQTFDFGFRDPEADASRLPGKAITNPPNPW